MRSATIEDLFPDRGPYRRELYPKHLAFFAAGKTERVRLLMAANRVGKTLAAGSELVHHLRGTYPDWWPGRVFKKPVMAWACGDTGKTVRDIVQAKLLGPAHAIGTGLIPKRDIVSVRPKAGVPNAFDLVVVRSKYGESILQFKSYDQKREAFQGTEQDVIDLDEEPPLDVQNECLLRTMPTGGFEGGLMMLPFTPLQGLTPLILHLRDVGTWEINITWDDVPHLTEEDKAEILRDTPAYLRDARTKGVPLLGAGRIFVTSEDEFVIAPFAMPPHWKQLGGLDFGGAGHPTAGAKLVFDDDTDVIYVTQEYRARAASAPLHASALRPWKLLWAWPHDGNQQDKGSGEQLAQQYRDEGLEFCHEYATFPTTNDENERPQSRFSVEAGLFEMQTRMDTGRWKVFNTCQQWLEEYRQYHRDEKGKVVKLMDDLICASRYAMMMRRYARLSVAAANRVDHKRRQRGKVL